MQIGTNVNYMAYISDCLIEICNTHTITFVYQTHFFSQFGFKLQLARNAFDCLLWVYGTGVMMVNIGTRVAPVNIAFSQSRNAAFFERKVLQYTTLSIKLHHWTFSEKKLKLLHCQALLLSSQYIAWIRNNTQTRTSFTKYFHNTLQTCINKANEDLQAYKIVAAVQTHVIPRHVFPCLHRCKRTGYTVFLIKFVLSN